MKVYYIVIGCISACVCLEYDKQADITVDSETLFNFLLELHEEVCGNVPQCRDNLNQTEQLSGLMFPKPCCVPCSCSDTCRGRGNCCPDYLMNYRLNNDTTSEHVSTIADDGLSSVTVPLTQATYKPTPPNTQKSSTRHMSISWKIQSPPNKSTSKMAGEQNSAEGMSVSTKHPFLPSDTDEQDNNGRMNGTDVMMNKTLLAINAVKTMCIKPQLFDHINENPDSQAYEMVVTCPINFQDSRCDAEFRNKYLYDLIPVTSSFTGITYANKHCLRCNELYTFEKALYSSWKVLLLFQRGKYVSLQIHDNPQWLLFDKMKFHYGNIHFMPPNPSFTQICQHFDVTKCNHTGLWDMYDRQTALACEYGFRLPVIHQINDKPLMFKNSACLNCNIPRQNRQSDNRLSCKGHFNLSPRYNMTINVQPMEKADTSRDANKIPEPVINNISFPRQNFLECPPGYVGFMNRCRKLLCPRDYYKDQNYCRPLYGVISGLNLYLKLEIIPTQVINSAVRLEFAEALKKKISDTVEKFMSILDFSLWYLPQSKTNAAEHYLYNVYFYDPSDKLEFGSAIGSVQNVVNTLRQESIITLKNGYRINLQYRFGHKITYFKSSSIIHTGMQPFGMFLPLMDKDWRLKIHNPYMTVSDSNWCYRIAFSTNEIQVLSTDTVKIAGTSIIVNKDQFDIINGPNAHVLVCANLFKELVERLKNPPDVKLSNIFITEGMDTTSASHWALSKTGILTWSVLGIVLFCIVFYKVKTTMKKSYNEQAQTIDNIEQAQSSTNIVQAQAVNNTEQARTVNKTEQAQTINSTE